MSHGETGKENPSLSESKAGLPALRRRISEKRPFLEARARFTRALRAFFDARGFLEVETPIVTAHGTCEPHIEPFLTQWADDRGHSRAATLIPSPEIHLKKLAASGCPKIWELARVFRNQEPVDSPWHNHQFSLLEWYRQGESWEALMDDAESLIRCLAGRPTLEWNGRRVDLARFERLSVREAFARYANIDFDLEWDKSGGGNWDWLRPRAAERGYGSDRSVEDAFYLIFLNEVEPKLAVLDHPVFLHSYPSFQAAFSRLDPSGRYGERVELFIAGVELCNGYGELCDGKEQLKRFHEGNRLRSARGAPVCTIDEQFPGFLEYLDPCCGMALGWDRLVMLLTGATSVDKVIAFPDRELFSQ